MRVVSIFLILMTFSFTVQAKEAGDCRFVCGDSGFNSFNRVHACSECRMADSLEKIAEAFSEAFKESEK